jgi:hypothetical protein
MESFMDILFPQAKEEPATQIRLQEQSLINAVQRDDSTGALKMLEEIGACNWDTMVKDIRTGSWGNDTTPGFLNLTSSLDLSENKETMAVGARTRTSTGVLTITPVASITVDRSTLNCKK